MSKYFSPTRRSTRSKMAPLQHIKVNHGTDEDDEEEEEDDFDEEQCRFRDDDES